MMRKLGMTVVAMCLAGSSAGVARAQAEPKSVVAPPVAGKVQVPDGVMKGVREAVPGFRMRADGATPHLLAFTLDGHDAEGREVQVEVTKGGFVRNIATRVALDDLAKPAGLAVSDQLQGMISDQLRGMEVTRVYRQDTRFRVLGLHYQVKSHMVVGMTDGEASQFAIQGPTKRIP